MREIFHRSPLLPRAAAALVALVLLAGLLTTGVLLAVGAWAMVLPNGVAAAVCLAAALLALLPLWGARRQDLSAAVGGCLASMVVRAIATVAGAVVLVETMQMPRTTLVAWVLGWYLLLLGAETVLIARSLVPAHGVDRKEEASGC